MRFSPIALAVPFFFVGIAIDLLIGRRRGRRDYRVADALTDLSCGITQQMAVLFFAAVQLGIYVGLYEQHRLITWQRGWVPWVIAFVGVDFFYYWWHRLSHEVNFLWAAHVVHHSSEDYNLAVALRQAVLTSWTGLPFYLGLAFVGVPPLVWATTLALSTLYQFWIHTQLVPRIRGPVGWILNLPSHHRVHHAINPEYLDKNYGATLIVWDRLFGTFQEEEAAPVYGITKPIGRFDPIWAQVHYWFELVKLSSKAPHFWDKLRVWVRSPAWTPRGLPSSPPRAVSPATYHKFDRPPSRRLAAYLVANYAVVVAGTFALMLLHKQLPRLTVALGAGLVVGAVWSTGALIEGRRFARPFEALRQLASAGLVAWLILT